MSEPRPLARNIWTSWVGYGLRIVLGFLFVPYITSILGDARYGVWILVFQTINYFVLLDFGLERALLRFISKHLSSGQFGPINRILNTAFNVYLVVGSLIIAGTWLVATFLFDYFRVGDPALLSEGKSALIIIGVYMGLRFYLLPFAGSLGGFQRFDISNWLHMLEDLVRTVIMVALLASGQGLIALALVILGVSILKQAAAIVWLRRLHPQVRFSPRTADRSTARELLDYSGITFGITICWLVIYNTDSILLGLLVSTSAAGIYAAGAQIVFYMRNVVNVIASPLTAEFSAREAAGDMAGVGRLYLKVLKYTSFLSFFMSSAVIIYARPFVALWLNPEFAEAAEVMRILAIGSAFLVPQIVGEAVLFAVDRHRLLLRALLIEGVLRIGLSLWLITEYGLLGMAYAAIIPQVVLYVSLYPAMLARVLKLPLTAVLMAFVQTGFPAMFACVPVAILMRVALPPLGWVAFAANVIVVSLATLAAGWLILAREDRTAVLSKIRRR